MPDPMLTRRSFLSGLGLFTILPSAGRVWKALRSESKILLVSAVDLRSDYERYCSPDAGPTHGWFVTVTGSEWVFTGPRALSRAESLGWGKSFKERSA